MKKVPLKSKIKAEFAIVDDVDYLDVREHEWVRDGDEVKAVIEGTKVRLDVFLFGVRKKRVAGEWNDYRRECFGEPVKRGRHKYRAVSPRGKKFQARPVLKKGGKPVSLGLFDSEEEAAAAVKAARTGT